MINGGEQVVQSMVTKCSGYQKETIAFISDVFGRIYLSKSPISFLPEMFKKYMGNHALVNEFVAHTHTVYIWNKMAEKLAKFFLFEVPTYECLVECLEG